MAFAKMIDTVIRLTLLLLIATGLLACSHEGEIPDPKTLPYRFEKVQDISNKAFFSDLDGDGIDEVVRIARDTPDGSGGVILSTQEGRTIEQINFATTLQRPIHFLDVQRDGTRLVVVTFVQNDSLFAAFIDDQGKKQNTLFLTSGQPRRTEEGQMLWDPVLYGFWLVDEICFSPILLKYVGGGTETTAKVEE